MTEPRPAALITGASRGIGARIATLLAQEGWDVTVSARSHDTLAAAANVAAAGLGEVHPVTADMAVSESVEQLAGSHTDRFGRLDLLVLNAGMGSIGAFADFPLRRLDKLIAVNVRSAFQLIQCMMPLMRTTAAASPAGARVVAISSMTGIAGEPLNAAYGATKAALTSLCDTLSTEESRRGVNATAICPGYVATDMTVGLSEQVPTEDMITIEDVAVMVIALTRLSRRTVVPFVPMSRAGSHLWRA